MRYPGRHYHRRYGYPLKWAVLAELAWRLEHAHLGELGDGLRSRACGWRKHFERKATRV